MKKHKKSGKNGFKQLSCNENFSRNNIKKTNRSFLKNSTGITLIALVISIIVMLILAGVSLNAVVGDNGVLTQAQYATYAQSAATLSEFLKLKYAESEIEQNVGSADDDTKTPLSNLKKYYPEWFYNPQLDPSISYPYDYIYYFDEETNSYYSLYFVKKSGLISSSVSEANDIGKKLVGGNAIDNNGNSETYNAYSALMDCYLVSNDLEVYYIDGALPNGKIDKNTEGGLKVVYEEGSSWANLLSNGEAVSIQDSLSISSLEINGNDNIKDLSQLYALSNLKSLTLTDYTGSLKGIANARNLTKLYIQNKNNTMNIDYTDLDKATNLTELYFYMPTDKEVEKMCIAMSTSDYTRLTTLGLYGLMPTQESAGYTATYINNTHSKLTNVAYLDKLTENTKNKIVTLYLQNNALKNTTGLEGFTKVVNLQLQYNYIANVNGLANMGELTNLRLFNNYASESGLTDLSGLDNCAKLKICVLSNNAGVTNLSTFTKNKSLTYLDARSCGELDFSTNSFWTQDKLDKLAKISTLYLDGKYGILFTAGNYVAVTSNVSDADFKKALENNATIVRLNCDGNKNITDATFQAVLPTMKNLQYINLDNTNIDSLNFISTSSYKTKYKAISIKNTNVNTITPLEGATGLTALRANGTKLQIYKEGDINFNKINTKIINEVCNSAGCEWTPQGFNGAIGGCQFASENLFRQLEKLTDIEYFYTYASNDKVNSNLDLRNTKLKRMYTSYNICSGTLYLPETVQYLTYGNIAGEVIIENGSNLITVNLEQNANLKTKNPIASTHYELILSSRSSSNFSYYKNSFNAGVETVTWKIGWSDTNLATGSTADLVALTNLKTLTINQMKFSRFSNEDLPVTLKSLTLNNNQMNSFKNVNNLNLTYLSIINNQFSSVADFADNAENSTLETLDLRNNFLQNTTTYKDEEGNNVTISTAAVLAKFPKLTTLKLSGNKDLTDFNALTSAGFVNDGNNNFTRTLK